MVLLDDVVQVFDLLIVTFSGTPLAFMVFAKNCTAGALAGLADRICKALTVHATVEEEIS